MLRADSYNIYINKNKTVNTTSKNLNDRCAVWCFMGWKWNGKRGFSVRLRHPANHPIRTQCRIFLRRFFFHFTLVHRYELK